MYVQINDICSQCGNEIPNRQEVHYLGLIDREHPTYFVTDDGQAIVSPRPLWEYCLCNKCFQKFNSSVRNPYKPL